MPGQLSISPEQSHSLSGHEVSRGLLALTPFQGFEKIAEKALQLGELEELCASARQSQEDGSFFQKLLTCLNLSCECSAEDLSRIPIQGPVVVVANHPFGLVEGPTLGSLLLRIRHDVRFLANSLLLSFPELRDYVIPVDPFRSHGAVSANVKPLREALLWLKSGGLLVAFPAGEVASLQLPWPEIKDPAWNENIARIIQITRSTVVPAFLHGTNSPAFYMAGLFHPTLRTILLPRELLNKRGMTIRVSIGGPIRPQRLLRFSTNREAVDYLRRRTEILWVRQDRATRRPGHLLLRRRLRQASVDEAGNLQSVRDEIERLPPDHQLLENGKYLVCISPAERIPNTLLEIGRLREIAFRHVGEGTGKALDLDAFDAHYHHLVLWNRERNEVVGAYRLAGTDVVLSRFGPTGLYTSTLFRYNSNFLRSINPALELGRSFVRPEYQRDVLPLLLLWKGIGRFVAENPRYRIVFGPVSISNDYCSASRALMIAYLKTRCLEGRLVKMVKPRHKFRGGRLKAPDVDALAPLLDDVEELSKVIADLEPDKKGLPILLRQYLNLGGQILHFNIDHRFSRALDGLIVVDLVHVDRRVLAKYLGEAGARAFLSHHGADQAATSRPSSSASTSTLIQPTELRRR